MVQSMTFAKQTDVDQVVSHFAGDRPLTELYSFRVNSSPLETIYGPLDREVFRRQATSAVFPLSTFDDSKYL
jgi:hypothetical protein